MVHAHTHTYTHTLSQPVSAFALYISSCLCLFARAVLWCSVAFGKGLSCYSVAIILKSPTTHCASNAIEQGWVVLGGGRKGNEADQQPWEKINRIGRQEKKQSSLKRHVRSWAQIAIQRTCSRAWLGEGRHQLRCPSLRRPPVASAQTRGRPWRC